MGNFNLPWKWVCQTQTMFQDPEAKEVMNLVSLNREWDDNSLSLKFQGMAGQGMYSATYMQSLTKYIQAGFQMNYAVSKTSHLFFSALFVLGYLFGEEGLMFWVINLYFSL